MITCATAHVPLRRFGRRTGKVIGQCHRAVVPQVPRCLESEVPAGLDVHLCGQLRHPQDGADPELVRQTAPPQIHFTPTSAPG